MTTEQPNPKICVKWKHKTNGNIVKVAPWYEIPDPVVELTDDQSVTSGLSDAPRKIKFGTLVQVGWLLESDNGIYIGVGLAAKDAFEEIP